MAENIPFSRHIVADSVPADGLSMEIVANEDERKAIARFLDLPEVSRLEMAFDLKRPSSRSLVVAGVLTADLQQVCGVTLEPFDVAVTENTELRFVAPRGLSVAGAKSDRQLPKPASKTVAPEPHPVDLDEPDELVDGGVDLGVIAVETLTLALDPYPRKPGVAFEAPVSEDFEEHPFAALARLREGKNPSSGRA